VGEKDTCHNLFKRAVSDLKDQFPDRLAHLDQVVKAKSTLSVLLNIYFRAKKPTLIMIPIPIKKKGGNYWLITFSKKLRCLNLIDFYSF
jgi:hypothetical protein